ncbi:hypothetical protein C0995_000433, partial [Termitomyces sp. Mi166
MLWLISLIALEFLYFQKKTLQRDISIGNVLISSINGAENTEGCLIDFDYAKVVKKTKPTFLNQASNLILDEEQEVLRGAYRFWGKKLPSRVAHALASHAALGYLLDLRTIIKVSPSSEISLSEEDIGFLSGNNKQVPDLGDHTPQEANRSATLPFASPEVLDRDCQRIFPLSLFDYEQEKNSSTGPPPNVTPHDARHDLEALF